MPNLSELLELGLLTQAEYQEIAAWVESPLPESVAAQMMPDPLWEALNRAMVLAELDEDLATMH